MNGKRSRELRQLSGYVKAPKTPTPVGDRLHGWTARVEQGKVQVRPSKIGVQRYGFTDLGWQARSKYFDLRGRLRRHLRGVK
jgi:hypothetical protein